MRYSAVVHPALSFGSKRVGERYLETTYSSALSIHLALCAALTIPNKVQKEKCGLPEKGVVV